MVNELPTIVPHLVVSPAAEAIEFYKRALGFEEILRMPRPDGKVLHCQLKLGDSVIFVADEFRGAVPGASSSPKTIGGTTITIHLTVPDVDAAFARAVKEGATALMAPTDMFWGDRYGKLADPFGHHWAM